MARTELQIQSAIESKLISLEIFPLNVFYSYTSWSDEINGTLGISFSNEFNLEQFLELMEYKSLCDKSGFVVIPESNSVLITNGATILQLWSLI